MNILEELWKGNVFPAEQGTHHSEANQRTIEEELSFLSSLTEEQAEAYEHLTNSHSQCEEEEKANAFTQGFSLAVRLLVSSLLEST